MDPDMTKPSPLDIFKSSSATLDLARESVRATSRVIEELMTEHLHLFAKKGDKFDVRAKGKEFAGRITVLKGNSHGASCAAYELASDPQVSISGCDPVDATWQAHAYALNKDGKRLNGRTHAGGLDDGKLWIEGALFPWAAALALDLPPGRACIDFSEAYVENWMASTGPDDYTPLRPTIAASKQKLKP